MTDLIQDPPVPGANESVTIRIRVSDSDGIDTVRLRHSITNPSSNPSSVTMHNIGGDWYEGTIPGRTLGTYVVFHVTATDVAGVAARYPVHIEERTHPLVLNPSSASINDQRHIVGVQVLARDALDIGGADTLDPTGELRPVVPQLEPLGPHHIAAELSHRLELEDEAAGEIGLHSRQLLRQYLAIADARDLAQHAGHRLLFIFRPRADVGVERSRLRLGRG